MHADHQTHPLSALKTRNMRDLSARKLSLVLKNTGSMGMKGFPRSSVGKQSACDTGDPGSIPGMGRSPGEGNGNPLQYSCLENPMNRGGWQVAVHGVTRVRHDLATNTFTFSLSITLADSINIIHTSVQFSSVAQSCPTLCHPVNRSTPGLPVHHQLLELTQTHIHRVSDAIQPSHPLSSPSHPVPNPSQHKSLFQSVNSSHEVAKVLEFQL